MQDKKFEFENYSEEVQNELIFDLLTQELNYLKDYTLIHSQAKIYKPQYLSPKHHEGFSITRLASLLLLIIQRKYLRPIYLADIENPNAPILSENYCYMLFSDIKNLSKEERDVIQDVDLLELSKSLYN